MNMKLFILKLINMFTILKIKIENRGKNIKFNRNCKIHIKSEFEGGNRLGINTEFKGILGYGSYIGNQCKLSAKIGRFCSIASNVKSLSGTHPVEGFVSTSPAFYSIQKSCAVNFVKKQKFKEYKFINEDYDILIGNDVWICDNVSILGGVKIGDGAIIASNAVVTKDVEPYTVVGGVPAKPIKKRFSDEQISYLKEFKWWEKSIDWIKENAEIFDNIDEFIKKNTIHNNIKS